MKESKMFSFTNISGLISVLRIFGVYFIFIFFYILCIFFLSKETLFFYLYCTTSMNSRYKQKHRYVQNDIY